MAMISLRQLLDHAAENGYGIPAFNVNNLEQVQAIMEAASETDSPVIMQASAGARKYAGEAFLRHLISAAVEAYPHIPVVMHQDHGQSPAVCMAAIRSGFIRWPSCVFCRSWTVCAIWWAFPAPLALRRPARERPAHTHSLKKAEAHA